MDYGSSMGPVACPVCTLFLREGISLQKHLDTHPKEQVIEALIKASGASVPNPIQEPQSQISPLPSQITSPSPVNSASHVSSQSPYPVGPVFECPSTLNAVISPPQFASFSYQQFVNNGTVMIPQYAMAPQNNHMMQMLYSPYGMYHQQPISTMQMISPLAHTTPPATDSTTNSTIRYKSPNALAGGDSVIKLTSPEKSYNCPEPRPVIPEILEDNEALLPNTDIDLSSRDSVNKELPAKCDRVTNNQVEYREQQTQASNEDDRSEELSAEQQNYPETVNLVTENNENRIFPNLEQKEVVTSELIIEDIDMVVDKTSDDVDVELAADPLDKVEMEKERQEADEQELEKQTTWNSFKESCENDQSRKSPEVEQLEHLLITIIESDYDASTTRNNDVQKVVISTDTLERSENTDDSDSTDTSDLNKSSTTDSDLSINLLETKTYHYKHSLSAPSSPIFFKKSHKTHSRLSLRDEFRSNENISAYPLGFEATALENFVNRKNEEDPDADMEEVASTVLFKEYHEIEDEPMRSYTPSSIGSSNSGLRVRTDLNKSGPLLSNHLLHQTINVDEVIYEKINFPQIESSTEQNLATTNIQETNENSNKESESSNEKLKIKDEKRMTSKESATVHNSHNQLTDNIAEDTSRHIVSKNLDFDESNGNSNSKPDESNKMVFQKPVPELFNINEDAHSGPMNVFEFDGLQILVPSTFISEPSDKAISGTSQQSMSSSEGGTCIDEEIKSINMRADESMPPRGELSEQESNECTDQSTWQIYIGQEASRMSTSYDLMARETWEESEGSDNEIGGSLLDSRSLATHFTSSLFLDRDRKTPTRRIFKCTHCTEVFECPKERRVHITTVHKNAGASNSREPIQQAEIKDIKLLDGRMNMFDDIFVTGLHVPQTYHQPLLHQLQPPQQLDEGRVENDIKVDNLRVSNTIEISCNICNQSFSGEKSLQIHQRRMHIKEAVKRVRENAKCQICNQEFPSVILFNAHLKIHPLECGQCGKYFYRKQNFKLHVKRHLGIKPFPCTVCDKAFLTKQKLEEHTNGHTGNAPVKCNLCNETFRRYSNLTQHKNRHHLHVKKKLKDYICHCGEIFHTKKKLAWHKETHDEKPKACTYCNERFIHMASLTRHMRRAHNRRFVPDAQRESENVECPICKCIYLRSSLAVHMRVHNGERPYECQVCSKAFSTKWNLQLHKWTHAARSTKPFKCNQCNAAFYRHSDYTAHMNSHRNVRPYTCNYCGAQFIRKYNCLRHVKEHEENKAYTCDVCNKTFHRSYYLKEHLRVHSGARPYSCHICGKSSSTKSNHNKHVRIHHAREPVNTEN